MLAWSSCLLWPRLLATQNHTKTHHFLQLHNSSTTMSAMLGAACARSWRKEMPWCSCSCVFVYFSNSTRVCDYKCLDMDVGQRLQSWILACVVWCMTTYNVPSLLHLRLMPSYPIDEEKFIDELLQFSASTCGGGEIIANQQKGRKVFPGWYIFHIFSRCPTFLFFLGVATDEIQKPGTSDTSAQPESLPWWRPAANIYCTPFYLILGCKAEAGEAGQHRSSMIHDLRIHENTLPAVDQIITNPFLSKNRAMVYYHLPVGSTASRWFRPRSHRSKGALLGYPTPVSMMFSHCNLHFDWEFPSLPCLSEGRVFRYMPHGRKYENISISYQENIEWGTGLSG